MSIRFPDDVFLPPSTGTAKAPPRPARLLAFVPIAIALIGVGAILIGSLTVRGPTSAATRVGTDLVTTGSIDVPPKSIQQILEMLDR